MPDSPTTTTLLPDIFHHATNLSFILIRLEANPKHRVVVVDAYLDGQKVLSASAADNDLKGVFSSGVQSVTLPVPPGSKGSYKQTEGSPDQVQAVVISI